MISIGFPRFSGENPELPGNPRFSGENPELPGNPRFSGENPEQWDSLLFGWGILL